MSGGDAPAGGLPAALGACGLHVAVLLSIRLAPGAAPGRLLDPCAVAFLVLWVGWSALEAGLGRAGPEPTGRTARRERAWAAVAGGALLALAWHGLWAAPRLPAGGPLLWLAAVGLALGVALRLAALRQLGPRFTAAACADPAAPLAREGVYRWVRHPSELGLLLASLSGAVLLRSPVSLALWAAAVVPLALARVRREERLLARVYGPAHEVYRRTTGLLLPRSRRT